MSPREERARAFYVKAHPELAKVDPPGSESWRTEDVAAFVQQEAAGLKERVRDWVMIECRRSGISDGKERILLGGVEQAFGEDPPGPPNPPVPPRDKPVS